MTTPRNLARDFWIPGSQDPIAWFHKIWSFPAFQPNYWQLLKAARFTNGRLKYLCNRVTAADDLRDLNNCKSDLKSFKRPIDNIKIFEYNHAEGN